MQNYVLGAIAGDIIGSQYEGKFHHSKDFELLTDKCRFTDDTVMTVAVMAALLEITEIGRTRKNLFGCYYKYYGRKYPIGFGHQTKEWLFSDTYEPYNSERNGSAMRVSPCAYVSKKNPKLNYDFAAVTAATTHNHENGIKGALAIVRAIFLARTTKDKDLIKKEIEKDFGYDLSPTIDDLCKDEEFSVLCIKTVPKAIICFLEGDSFEDVIRNAVCIGGDTDTICDMAGAIAEAYYDGIGEELEKKILSYLPDDMRNVVVKFSDKFLQKEK